MFLKVRRLFLLLLILPIGTTLAGCSASASEEAHPAMLPSDQLPTEVQTAPRAVREAYQFAAANPEILQQIPCYCGCKDIHPSNYACYVSQVDSNGALVFDRHALNCSICVAITGDVIRLLRKGKSLAEIKSYIEATYGEYDTSTQP